ncbi:unnamed protein product [Adineta ricciae]|uniref:Uncharacterized protein n=1 Tax=Adineta ricciae TaxID=249248 RepID=A0A815UAZ6_ADIRI|nr:unnamed protein product [Adineta ricciae]
MYFMVYLYKYWLYNSLVAIFLYLINIPTFTRRDKIKFLCLIMMNLLYTTPCLTYLVSRERLNDDTLHVSLLLEHLSVERLLFIVIQNVIVVHFHMMFSKLTLPIVHIGKFRHSRIRLFLFIYFIPFMFLYMTYWTSYIEVSIAYSNELGTFISWYLPLISFLWFVTGEYIISNWKTTIATVLVSTSYFWRLDSTIIQNDMQQFGSNGPGLRVSSIDIVMFYFNTFWNIPNSWFIDD